MGLKQSSDVKCSLPLRVSRVQRRARSQHHIQICLEVIGTRHISQGVIFSSPAPKSFCAYYSVATTDYGTIGIKNSYLKILTQQDKLPTLEFVEISPKHKDKLLAKHKESFARDQTLYDKVNEYESTKVVHAEPRISKVVRPTPLPYGPLPKHVLLPTTYSVDTSSSWLCG